MKAAIKLVLVYFLFQFLGALTGGMLTMLYNYLTSVAWTSPKWSIMNARPPYCWALFI